MASLTHLLLLSKRLRESAVATRLAGGEVDCMQSVLLADLANETSLKALAKSLGRRQSSRLRDLCSEVSDQLPEDVLRRAMDLRREHRNHVMHEGRIPSPAVAEEACQVALELVGAVAAACGWTYASLSMVGLVQNPLVRAPLEWAEGRLVTDLEQARDGLRVAEHRSRGLLLEATASAVGADMTWFDRPLWHDVRYIRRAADGTHAQVLDYLESSSSSIVQANLPGRARFRAFLDREKPSAEECSWALDFVATIAYQLEQLQPQLRGRYQADRSDRTYKVQLPVLIEATKVPAELALSEEPL